MVYVSKYLRMRKYNFRIIIYKLHKALTFFKMAILFTKPTKLNLLTTNGGLLRDKSGVVLYGMGNGNDVGLLSIIKDII